MGVFERYWERGRRMRQETRERERGVIEMESLEGKAERQERGAGS